ncbi:unnamed protein product, partial [Ectocarpus sp. 8 AP-2014]
MSKPCNRRPLTSWSVGRHLALDVARKTTIPKDHTSIEAFSGTFQPLATPMASGGVNGSVTSPTSATPSPVREKIKIW